jgi:hypothetical protein
MPTGDGQLVEVFLDRGGRIQCPPELIPSPGQYLLSHAGGSDAALAAPLFLSEASPWGFRTAPPLVDTWKPGTRLHLRGPLGHGFSLPESAGRVALIAYDDSPARLRGLIPLAMNQDAVITLVSESVPEDLPEDVEVQPITNLGELVRWADFAAVDVSRENLRPLREKLATAGQTGKLAVIQILIRTSMPCGACAECGVCAVALKDGWTMVCRDGPVYDFEALRHPG